ncbi:MAG TPA: hypothetical protein VHE99_12835 [Gammaproteobacteria bacterium]|nr:hypothetical protein [Gammaproteobacteria bacterium]
MLADLPMPIQKQILSYLEADNFRAAKELHDSFLLYKINKQNYDQDDSFDDDEDEKS